MVRCIYYVRIFLIALLNFCIALSFAFRGPLDRVYLMVIEL